MGVEAVNVDDLQKFAGDAIEATLADAIKTRFAQECHALEQVNTQAKLAPLMSEPTPSPYATTSKISKTASGMPVDAHTLHEALGHHRMTD